MTGNVDLLKEKLGSITGHLSDQHKFSNNLQHQACCHAPLGPAEQRRKKWLAPDSLVGCTFELSYVCVLLWWLWQNRLYHCSTNKFG